MRAFTLFVVTAAAASAFVLPGGASAMTKPQAYQKARACLVGKGSAFVIQRADGGGYATFRREGLTYWTYDISRGQVSSAKVYFSGLPGLSAARQRQVKACVTAGL